MLGGKTGVVNIVLEGWMKSLSPSVGGWGGCGGSEPAVIVLLAWPVLLLTLLLMVGGEEKYLIVRASGSWAIVPETEEMYFVSGKDIDAVCGVNDAATKARRRGSEEPVVLGEEDR